MSALCGNDHDDGDHIWSSCVKDFELAQHCVTMMMMMEIMYGAGVWSTLSCLSIDGTDDTRIYVWYRCVEDYELSKQLYKGKASLLFAATCQRSRMPVALKLYRKSKLSDLNWYQASRPAPCCISRNIICSNPAAP